MDITHSSLTHLNIGKEGKLFIFVRNIVLKNYTTETLMFILILVMQYIGGGELYHLVEEYGCLSEDVVKIYIGEIALALGKKSFLNHTKKCNF